MATTFALKKPVETATPTVDAALENTAPGKYTFELVVIDDLGNESQPVTTEVEVRELPVAKIVALKPVPVGKPFTLNGGESTPQQHIKTYRWTLVSEAPALKPIIPPIIPIIPIIKK